MARCKKGLPLSGWIIVDKPPGITSTTVVNKIKWAFDAQKAGHAGTLDPAATGVLAVALGEATKTVPFVTDAQKCYRFMIRFGASTDTDDAEGQILSTRDVRPDDEAIRAGLLALTGDILQVPPQFSAVKVDGQRAYALAREGQQMDLAARALTVSRLVLVDRPDADHALVEMVCGKGGYVRSVARDLGAALGCLGHVLWLRRVWSGPFHVDDAVTMEEIEAAARSPEIRDFLKPLAVGLTGLPQVEVTASAAALLRHGNAAPVTGPQPGFDALAWAGLGDEPIAVGNVRHGMLFPSRVFVADQPAGSGTDA